MELNIIKTETNGSGYWSKALKNVSIFKLEPEYIDEDESFMSLNAYFLYGDWDYIEDGLIYTDKLWIETFRRGLKENGFSDEAVKSVGYSEEGKQGDDFVNLDCGKAFTKEWVAKN